MDLIKNMIQLYAIYDRHFGLEDTNKLKIKEWKRYPVQKRAEEEKRAGPYQ